eukprot:jgi/Chrzof1/1330/Cz10g03070.t1
MRSAASTLFGLIAGKPSAAAAFVRCIATQSTTKLYVGNLSWQATAEDVARHFTRHGDVTDVYIPVNFKGLSRGFAFVEISSDAADQAIKAEDGAEFMGRPLRVNEAQPQQPRSPTGYREQRHRDQPHRDQPYRQRRQQQQQDDDSQF